MSSTQNKKKQPAPEAPLDATTWVCRMQALLDDVSGKKKEPGAVHMASLYDYQSVSELTEPVLRASVREANKVSWPVGRDGKQHVMGAKPAGLLAKKGAHKGIGFDPPPHHKGQAYKVRIPVASNAS